MEHLRQGAPLGKKGVYEDREFDEQIHLKKYQTRNFKVSINATQRNRYNLRIIKAINQSLSTGKNYTKQTGCYSNSCPPISPFLSPLHLSNKLFLTNVFPNVLKKRFSPSNVEIPQPCFVLSYCSLCCTFLHCSGFTQLHCFIYLYGRCLCL